MTYRYLYLGDALTDPKLVDRLCNPVRRDDGKCIVSQRFATQLVRFKGETCVRVVKRRRLRLVDRFVVSNAHTRRRREHAHG